LVAITDSVESQPVRAGPAQVKLGERRMTRKTSAFMSTEGFWILRSRRLGWPIARMDGVVILRGASVELSRKRSMFVRGEDTVRWSLYFRWWGMDQIADYIGHAHTNRE
jgi:hypothetical protein